MRFAAFALSVCWLAACGPGLGGDDGGGDEGSGGATSSGSSGTTRGTGTSSDASSTSGTASSSTTGPDCSPCFVDFPCTPRSDHCVDTQSIQRHETVSCELAEEFFGGCGPQCCSGSACNPSHVESCRASTSCVETAEGAQCLPDEGLCNASDRPCSPGSFCEHAQGLCPSDNTVLGQCVEATPDPCPEPAPGDRECGCDGTWYDSACLRRQAGVGRDDNNGCFASAPERPKAEVSDDQRHDGEVPR